VAGTPFGSFLSSTSAMSQNLWHYHLRRPKNRLCMAFTTW
jgi:hypothetical protein